MAGGSSLSRQLGAIALVLAIWFGLGFVVESAYYRLLLATIPLWAVLAIAWNLFSGYSGLVSFGHATFFGIGAFTVVLALRRFDLTPWFGIPLGAALGALAAAAIGAVTFRLRGTYFALAMLAYPLALLYLFDWLGLTEVTFPIKRGNELWYMQFGDYRPYMALSLALLGLALCLSLWMERSRFGLSLLAIKQNELAAEAAGIDTFAWKLKAIVLSGGLAAAAGGLYATVLLVVTPHSVFGLGASAQAMILTLFGGAGTLWGPLIGAVVLVPLSEILHAELGHSLPGLQGLVYGVAIILVILLAPEGIYWRIRDALFAGRPPAALAAPSPDGKAANVVRLHPLPGPAKTGEALLRVEGLSKRFGGLRALENVSFEVAAGAIVGIIGPNGAGKTTLFNLLNGILPPSAGKVVFEGRDITGAKPNAVCAGGIARTFQVVRSFPRMSLLENVVVGAFVAHRTDAAALDQAREAIALVGLTARMNAPASTLTNKELRLMELARALSSPPKLILMDEPLAGLGGSETAELIAIVRRLPALGVTVVIIEHTMKAMVSAVDRFIVLDHGELLADGKPQAVIADPKVIEAYLGRKWAQNHAAG
jgi:branched-chain amino acid transport system permease protein